MLFYFSHPEKLFCLIRKFSLCAVLSWPDVQMTYTSYYKKNSGSEISKSIGSRSLILTITNVMKIENIMQGI